MTTDAIQFDTIKLLAGFGLMFLYTMSMLGRANAVEHRAYLAAAGLLAVGFGVVAALGLTMAVGMFYTTMHGILPFLCLGAYNLINPQGACSLLDRAHVKYEYRSPLIR